MTPGGSAKGTEMRGVLRVVIVDDDEGILFLVGEYLHSIGIHARAALNAAQARKLLAHGQYDLVISDLQMPGESGLDLFRTVSYRYPGLPFILMSGNLDSRVKREAIGMGICNFVEKPFELSSLKRLIMNLKTCSVRIEVGAPAA